MWIKKYDVVSYHSDGFREEMEISEETYKSQREADSKVGYILTRGDKIVHAIPNRRVSVYTPKLLYKIF